MLPSLISYLQVRLAVWQKGIMHKSTNIMHKSRMTKISRRIGVVLFDRFSNHCLANAVEPLRAANSLVGYRAYAWDFLTLDGSAVTSSSGLPVAANAALGQSGRGDVLFVLPSYGFRDLAQRAARPLKAAANRYRIMAGLDAGSWLLAHAGLLAGKRATIHWEELGDFAEAFPDVRAERARVVRDGTIWTCAGAMTAFDLVLELIRDDFGPLLALEVAAFLMHGSEGADAPLTDLPRPTGNALVTAAVSVMRDNIEEPLSLSAIAARLNVPLTRLKADFAEELGQPPGRVYRRLRLSTARRYVDQTALSVAEIAVRCGYEDAAAMTRAFRQAFGLSPRAMRGGA